MAEAISTPRINSTYLENFTNQTVRLTGKVVQLRGEQATVDAMGNVTAHLNRVCWIFFLNEMRRDVYSICCDDHCLAILRRH